MGGAELCCRGTESIRHQEVEMGCNDSLVYVPTIPMGTIWNVYLNISVNLKNLLDKRGNSGEAKNIDLLVFT